MGSIVPTSLEAGALPASTSKLLVYHARAGGINKKLRLLVDSGATDNFCRRQTLRENPDVWQRVKRLPGDVAVRLATGAVKRAPLMTVDLQLKFGNFRCKEEFVVLDMDERYDLILGIKWLRMHDPCIDWRQGRMAPSQGSQKPTRDSAFGSASLLQDCGAGQVDGNPHGGAQDCATGQTGAVPSERSVATPPTSAEADGAIVPGCEASEAQGDVGEHIPTPANALGGPSRSTIAAGDHSRFASRGAQAALGREPAQQEPRRAVRFASDIPDGNEVTKLREMEYQLFLAELKVGRIEEILVPTPRQLCELNASSNADEEVNETDR